MILSDVSIKRPVFASVLSLLLILFGLIAFQRLSLREYPDIDPPIVTVEVDYRGAPANVVETRVTKIVEDRIAGIEGIDFIESTSQDGRSRVTIEFKIDRDIDAAANDVRDRVAGIADDLPEEADPPEVQKVDSNDDVIIWQNLTSTNMTVPELTDYAERFLVDRYSTLDGVARVRVGGGLPYAMRIWVDRQKLAARKLTVSDVEAALRRENIELPAGSLESDQRLFKARITRYFKTAKDFERLVLAEGEDENGSGYLVRLSDVARVEKGVVEDRTFFRGNKVPMVGIGVIRQSTANTIDVANGVMTLTEKINKSLPDGMVIEKSYNAAVFIEASIKEVYKTLFFAVSCVILAILVFLRSARAMIVPAVTVPVSLMATFIIIYAFGFSINILTLLALVLAIGLVVDDAIVMIENIVRRINEKNEPPLLASYRGSRQVGFAIIATTLVLISVFVPITFLQGDIGRLFTEFAITISGAVAFSSLVALTLSPMLASKILTTQKTSNRFFDLFDAGLARTKKLYIALLTRSISHAKTTLVALILIAVSAALVYPRIDKEFAPYEDRGAFFVIVNGPEGASYDYMENYMTQIEDRLMPYVDNKEFNRLLVRAPRGFGNLESFSSGIVIVVLNDWAKRRPAKVILSEVRTKLSDLPGVRAFPVMRQGLGGGIQKPVQFIISGSTYEELTQWRDILMQKIKEDNPGFLGLDSSYKETRPQIDFDINYDRAADMGVSIQEIGRTLETMMGGREVTTFLDRGEEYDVILEGERNKQRSFADLKNIYVKSSRSKDLIPLSNLVTIREYGAAETLTRFNRIRSITLEANLADNLSLGRALEHLEQLAKKHLPAGVVIDYKGQSRDFKTSSQSMFFIFLLGLVVVFLVLAAQFESWVHPFVIMLTVPLAMTGGLLALYLTNGSINIYSQIGLIVLVGVAAKNGILIVEFANQLRDEGQDFSAALLNAAEIRFRPILMTGVTTFVGAIPLVLSSGAGSETRIVIGTVILGGILAATLFTLFIVPAAYVLFARNTGSAGDVERALKEAEKKHKARP